MKAVVNLAGRKKQVFKTKTLVLRGFWIFVGVWTFLFLVYFIIPVWKTYTLKKKIELVNSDAVLISSQIRSDNDFVNKFVLSKSILDQVERINSTKFAYKRYMDEIVAILPASVTLRNVDFQNRGWVSVSASAPDIVSIRDMEERITDKTIIDQTVFSSIFSEEFSKEKTGGYIIKMHFELKQNGRS